MELSPVKQRIIHSAGVLFNQHGIANVRLNQISEKAGMSAGNLVYYYKNKDAIVDAVYSSLFEEFAIVLGKSPDLASLTGFDKQLSGYYAFFERNRFYLFDVFEITRKYPAINHQWQVYITKMVNQVRTRVDAFAVAGILRMEINDGDFDLLTQSISTTILFWIPQQIICGKEHAAEMYRRATWGLVTPYLSLKGMGMLDAVQKS